MAKINIEFDGKIYSVDENTLAPLASPLERALIQQLAGTGAVIRLGGTNYNVDANKLASARNVLTNQLGNVVGTDSKVIVNGVEYGLSKTKLQGATDTMHETLGGMRGPSEGLLYALNDDGQSYDVISIGDCKDLDVIIPTTYNGLPVIGLRTGISGGPFAYSNIRSIVIPDSVIYMDGEQFQYCSELKEVTIGSGVTYIDETVFRYSGCIDVNISEYNPSYKSIDGAVYTKDGKTLVYYPIGKTRITPNIVIPDGVEIIPDYVFRHYYDIVELTLPNSVTYIGDDAFMSCSKLEHIVMSNNITTIGQQAFYGCERLKDIVIPSSVVSIGEQAFKNCFKLTEVMNNSALDIVKGATTHGYVACYAVNVNQGKTSQKVNINGYVFYTVDNSHYLVDYVGSNAELVLPDGYNGENYAIYQYAFFGNENITKVVMSDKVISMGEWAFYRCLNLAEVVISSNITHISNCAFISCQNLRDVTIPEGVLAIGDRAFSESGLQNIHLPNTLTTIGRTALGNCPLEQIVIPNSVTTIHEYAFYSDWTSWLTNIYIDKPENSIAGAPWQAYRATIHWNSTGPET